jgi:hypothetical protein
MTSRRAAWDQLPDEPAAAFNRFQVYLHLGAKRSIRAAWERFCEINQQTPRNPGGKAAAGKRQKASKSGAAHTVSGQWYKDSIAWNWVDRATAYDQEKIERDAQSVASNYFAGLNSVLRSCSRFFDDNDLAKVAPAKTNAARDAFRAAQEKISEEVLLACLHAGGDRDRDVLDESLPQVPESPNLLHPRGAGAAPDARPGEHRPPDPLAAS